MRLKRDTLCSFVSDFLLQLWTLCFLDEASSVIEVRTTMTEYFRCVKLNVSSMANRLRLSLMYCPINGDQFADSVENLERYSCPVHPVLHAA
jgi:hypothetical protein